MADEAQYESHKRKYEEDTSPPRVRRPTGFSDGPSPAPAPYGNVPPPLEDFQLAKQKIQELASLAFNAEAKRSKFDNGGYSSNVNVLPGNFNFFMVEFAITLYRLIFGTLYRLDVFRLFLV